MSMLPPAAVLGWHLHRSNCFNFEMQSGTSLVFIILFSVWQTPHDPRGSTRWMGETIILCPHENRWRRTSRATGSSRRDSTTATCMGQVSKVSARWQSRYAWTETETNGNYVVSCKYNCYYIDLEPPHSIVFFFFALDSRIVSKVMVQMFWNGVLYKGPTINILPVVDNTLNYISL